MECMEFKRIEIKKVVAAQRNLKEDVDVKALFEVIKKNKLTFSVTIANGTVRKECAVIEVKDAELRIFSQSPCKVTQSVKFAEILVVEVESNSDFMAEENDAEGRWSRII
jgi:hypothetical protein